jgi:amino acid transporter
MSENALKSESVGLWELVFQSMGQITPITILSGLILSIVGFSMGAAPLVMVISMLAVLLSANTIYQFSGRVAHAGGYYAYVAHGLGTRVGVFTGFQYVLYQVSNLALEYLIVAWGFSKSINYALGIQLPIWAGVVWISAMTALSYYLMLRGVRPSLRLSLVLGAIQVLFIFALSAFVIARAPDVTLAPFLPSSSPNGWQGVFIGFIAGGYLAFAGYGSVVPMGEEARAPKETIRKAVLYAVLLAGFAFIIGSYAMVVGYGLPNLSSFTSEVIPGLIVARRFMGVIGAYAFIIVGTFLSTYGTVVGMGTPLSRVIFSLARDGIFPRYLSTVRSGNPTAAINATYLISVSLAVLVGLAFYESFGFYTGIYYAWAIFGIIATLSNLLIHILSNASLSILSIRNRTRWLAWLVAPTASTVIMLIAYYFSLMGLGWPFELAPLSFICWSAISILWVFRLNRKRSQVM